MVTRGGGERNVAGPGRRYTAPRDVMDRTLDYATVSQPAARGASVLPAFGMILAVLGASASVYMSIDGAMVYLESFGGCAWGRGEALFQLRMVAPVACWIAGMGWMLAAHGGWGVLLCRTALLMGIAGWLTACVR